MNILDIDESCFLGKDYVIIVRCPFQLMSFRMLIAPIRYTGNHAYDGTPLDSGDSEPSEYARAPESLFFISRLIIADIELRARQYQEL